MQNLHMQSTVKAGDILSELKIIVSSYSAVSRAENPGIYLSYLFSSKACWPSWSPKHAWMSLFQTLTFCWSFCFWYKKPSNSRLGPAKVPQPGVDLINIAAPMWCRALTICAPEFKGLLLLCSVLVWYGRGSVAIKEALKEYHTVTYQYVLQCTLS